MNLDFLTRGTGIDEFQQAAVQEPFARVTLDFLESLSGSLLRREIASEFAEIAALGFWLRSSNLVRLRDDYWRPTAGAHYRALGTVLHIAPANVDTMFVYSWACSLLMGNRNIVRVSSRRSAIIDVLAGELNEHLQKPVFSELSQANIFVRYEHDDEITKKLSAMADARVIWGGDQTVSLIRAMAAKPTTRDIAFADKYSVAIIDGDKLADENVKVLAERLWRDTHPYEQMACSSPRAIFWLGSTSNQESLFQALADLARPQCPENRVNEHLVASQSILVNHPGARVKQLGPVSVVAFDDLEPEMMQMHPGGGLYFLVEHERVADVLRAVDSKCQTLSLFGVDSESVFRCLAGGQANGVVRVVPCGQALDFAPLWDGYDLFSELTVAALCRG